MTRSVVVFEYVGRLGIFDIDHEKHPELYYTHNDHQQSAWEVPIRHESEEKSQVEK